MIEMTNEELSKVTGGTGEMESMHSFRANSDTFQKVLTLHISALNIWNGDEMTDDFNSFRKNSEEE